MKNYKSLFIFDIILFLLTFSSFLTWVVLELLIFDFVKVETKSLAFITLFHNISIVLAFAFVVSIIVSIYKVVSKSAKNNNKSIIIVLSIIIAALITSASIYTLSNNSYIKKSYENEIPVSYYDKVPYAKMTKELLDKKEVYNCSYYYEKAQCVNDCYVFSETDCQGLMLSPEENVNQKNDYEEMIVSYSFFKSDSKAELYVFDFTYTNYHKYEERTYNGKTYFVKTDKNFDNNTNSKSYLIKGEDYIFWFDCIEGGFNLSEDELLKTAFEILELIEPHDIYNE